MHVPARPLTNKNIAVSKVESPRSVFLRVHPRAYVSISLVRAVYHLASPAPLSNVPVTFVNFAGRISHGSKPVPQKARVMMHPHAARKFPPSNNVFTKGLLVQIEVADAPGGGLLEEGVSSRRRGDMLARDDISRLISAGLPVMLGFLARTKTTIGLERPIEVFVCFFWPPAVVCHRGLPSIARPQVDHRTEIVAKLLNYAPAKPAHRDSALM